MKYITFKFQDKAYALKSNKFILEPTQINKIIAIVSDTNLVGYINYRGQNINVYDMSGYFGVKEEKKFDGLIFVHKEDESYAFKIEGFYQVKQEFELENEEIIDMDDIEEHYK